MSCGERPTLIPPKPRTGPTLKKQVVIGETMEQRMSRLEDELALAQGLIQKLKKKVKKLEKQGETNNACC